MIAYLQDFNLLSVCLRLALATLLGGIIGLERGSHGQPAGLRTFALVCLGAAVAMITGEYLVHTYATGDPARLAAQVISGIGFLGVGTIIVTGKNYVKGLTTAASLWTTACLGIAIGSGYILGSLVAFLFIVFVMTVLTSLSHYMDEHNTKIKLYLEVDKSDGIAEVYRYVEDNGYTITSIDKQKRQSLQGKDAVLIIVINLNKRCSHTEFIEGLNQSDSIHYIEEIR
ncbi:MAG: MgtC/SapB family protein [Lachnospiraceae bacterium]|nr:MgtC/SapB family protein [Lachnospiraceae bacterium]